MRHFVLPGLLWKVSLHCLYYNFVALYGFNVLGSLAPWVSASWQSKSLTGKVVPIAPPISSFSDGKRCLQIIATGLKVGSRYFI